LYQLHKRFRKLKSKSKWQSTRWTRNGRTGGRDNKKQKGMMSLGGNEMQTLHTMKCPR
jgi:hypothetical protein